MARRQSQETCQGVKPRVEARSAGQEGRQGQEAGPGGRARRPGQDARFCEMILGRQEFY